MPFEMYMKSFFSTNIAIYEEFGYEHYWEFSQTIQKQYIRVKNPAKQKFFITVETLSRRLKPNTCEVEPWLNIYLFKGGKMLNKDRLGFIGSLMFHDTVGDPFWTKEMDAGDYTLIVANWKLSEVPKIDYVVHVSQESKDKHITIDGKSGKKASSGIVADDLKKDNEGYDPSFPGPGADHEKERRKHDNWFPDIGLPNPFGAMGLFTAHSIACLALLVSISQ